MSGWSETENKIKMELEEEFCATLESIKSEEERNDDIEPATLPENYGVQRIGASSQYSEVTWQSNNDVSLSSRCRLCAIPDNDMVDMFNSPETEDILEKISFSLPIMVTEMDTLPKQICRFCLEELERCYRFLKTVAEAEEQLLTFDKLASMKSEGTKRNDDFFPLCDKLREPTEYNNIDAPFRTTTIPEEAQTSHTTVKGRVSSASWRPCAVWLPVTDTCCENNSDVENNRKSSSDTEDGNLSSTTEIFNSGRAIVPEMDEQSTCDLEVHMENPDDSELAHSEKQLYNCNICTKTFKWKSHLTRHIAVHDNMDNGPGPHKCNVCPKTFKWKSRLTEHNLIHTDKGIEFYKCDTCAKTFKWKSHLTRHIAVHNNMSKGIEPHRCNVCAKTFKWKSRLTEHSLVHMDKGPELYKCHTCGKTFKWKTNLIRHRVVHMDEGLQRHECNTCVKSFKWKTDLTKHNKIHTTKGLFSCEYCEKKFIKRAHRDRHQCADTHKGPLKCPVCEKSFSEDSALKRHATVHSEERNYPCTLCDKSFKIVGNRQRHMVVHTRNKL